MGKTLLVFCDCCGERIYRRAYIVNEKVYCKPCLEDEFGFEMDAERKISDSNGGEND